MQNDKALLGVGPDVRVPVAWCRVYVVDEEFIRRVCHLGDEQRAEHEHENTDAEGGDQAAAFDAVVRCTHRGFLRQALKKAQEL